MICTKI